MALVIVLSFVVLLTGVVLAFFTRVSANRVVSAGSSRQWEADQFARSALSVIVGDLKQEVTSGLPVTATNIEPQRPEAPASGPNPIPNLVRRSARSNTGTRAAESSSTDAAVNGRAISAARWNKHYLVPRLSDADDSDTAPDPTAGFRVPDWVYVTDGGPEVISAPEQTALARYAYAIYDVGGLLDANIAGFPPDDVPAPTFGPKGVLAFADLTRVQMSKEGINGLVGWRNRESANSPEAFGSNSFGSGPAEKYSNWTLRRADGYLGVFPSASPAPAPPAVFSRTDQAFVSRQQLIAFRRTGDINFSAHALQHLTTFTRARNRPTWSDSETRLAGRFSLSRFDLFTNPATNGTPTSGPPPPIQQYFGLVYVAASATTAEHWRYVGATGNTLRSTIPVLEAGSNREPDLPVLLAYAYRLPPGASPRDVLSIVASLIDLRDGNNDPNNKTTWIEFTGPDGTPQKAFGADVIPEPGAPAPPTPDLRRPFRSVGEIGYALKNGTTSVNFASDSVDTPLLDLFTYEASATRGGTLSLNTQNASALAAVLSGTSIDRLNSSTISETVAETAATAIVAETRRQGGAAVGRKDIGRLAAAANVGGNEEAVEAVARALSDIAQPRTWNLMIDVIAQAGRYPRTATDLSKFVVEGEKRYWLHVAIDRFTGEVIDQQLEPVYE